MDKWKYLSVYKYKEAFLIDEFPENYCDNK